jgi:hypothetical protein
MIKVKELKKLIDSAIKQGFGDSKVECAFYDENKKEFDLQPVSGADIIFNEVLKENILELY